MNFIKIDKHFSLGFLISGIGIVLSIYFFYLYYSYSLFLLVFIPFFLLICTGFYMRKKLVQLIVTQDDKLEQMEKECEIKDSFLDQLISAGNDLISELERDALLKKVRDTLSLSTNASAGYLLMYNQNRSIYEWGIGHNINQLKLKQISITSSDSLISKIIYQPDAVVFFEIQDLLAADIMHVREEVIPTLIPVPETLVAVRLKMKAAILGIQILLLSRENEQRIRKNIRVFDSLVNLSTLALGTAVQREFAINDRMTMMYNHEYFISRLKEEIAMCSRVKGRVISLLMLDIDHFKKFNDTYGHQIGDYVLIETAKICRESVRVTDIVARYGGEEFAIILPQTQLKDAVRVAEKIRSAVENKSIKTDRGELKVTVSIGVYSLSDPGSETVESMVKKSDIKLYESKEKGRNRISF